ncbi:MAG TPA: biosynthetic peptidoglycan transglycosylase, partial [Patescibacteria group bacterium]|nr:biosynthetic peptidoglycan transglycosylase [Patescibacteria group bacterium]
MPEDIAVTADLYPQSTRIYSRNKELLYQYSPSGTRLYVKLEGLPDHLVDAFLAVEDHRFYKHNGVSPIAITRAALANFQAGEPVQGGSTITQQLARILFLSPEVTLERKFKEMVLAFRLEQAYSKRDILELYLNKISFGSNIHGIEAASLAFFNKHASELTLEEAAVLAAMPKAPTTLFPYRNKDKLLKRQEVVLDLMAKYGYATPGRIRLAKEKEMKFKEIEHKISAPHFVFYTLDKLREKVGPDAVVQGF